MLNPFLLTLTPTPGLTSTCPHPSLLPPRTLSLPLLLIPPPIPTSLLFPPSSSSLSSSSSHTLSHHIPHLIVLPLFSHYNNRCIGTTDRSDGYLRQQLEEWLDIACEQRQYSRGAKVVLNEQNRRYVQPTGLILLCCDREWCMMCACIFSDSHKGITVMTDLKLLPAICSFSVQLILPPVISFLLHLSVVLLSFHTYILPYSTFFPFLIWTLIGSFFHNIHYIALALVPIITPCFLSTIFLFLPVPF